MTEAATVCGVMVLRSVAGAKQRRDGRPPVLTKTLARGPDGAWRVASEYDNAFIVDAQEYPVSSIDELFALMQKAEPEPHLCFIRARLKDGATKASLVRRLLYDREDAAAPFEPAARHWLSLDLDSFPLPDGVSPTDVEAVINAAIARLPEPFRGATCVWQLTSGHGIKPGGRVRLWFWLSRALSTDELKAWLANIPAKPDPSVWAPVQPNYTARPECIGAEDFLPVRMGLRRASVDLVTAPEPAEARQRHTGESTSGNFHSRGLGFDGYLERIGDQPDYPLGEGFHEPLKSAVAAAVRDDPHLDVHELEEQLAAVIRERGHTRPPQYIATRLRDLPRLIAGIVRMEKAREERSEAGPAETGPPEGWAPPTMSAEEASAALAKPLEAFWHAAELSSARRLRRLIGLEETPPAWMPGAAPDAPQHLIKVDVGTGKTEQSIRSALRFCAGEFQDPASPRPEGAPRRVAFLVNDHKLGKDLLRRFEEIAPGSAQLWQGLERPDPSDPAETMCRRLDDIRELLSAKGEPSDLCGSKKRGYCPHHPKAESGGPVCAYRMQQDRGTPIVIIAGPSSLVQSPPKVFQRRLLDDVVDPFDAIVVDETRPTELFKGVSGRARRVPSSVFVGGLGEPATPGKLDRDDIAITAERLSRLAEMLERATAGMEAGTRRPLTLGEFQSTGLTAEACRSLRKALFVWVVKPVPDPRLTGPGLVEALKPIKARNKRALALARLAFCAAQALDDNPGAEPETRLGQIGVETGEEAGFVVAWREPIAKPLENTSTLVLDGTANADLLRPWLPRIAVTASIEVAAPAGVEIVQVWDRRCGYQSWTPQGDPSAPDATKTARTAERNLQRLARWLELLARTYGDVAAIVPLAAETWLAQHWGERQPVRLAHYGAIRGFDGFRAVRALVVWSRPAPGPLEMEKFAAVYRGAWGASAGKGEWYPEAARPHLLRDGSAREGKGDRHPDPTAEAYRVQITEAEIGQAIGRSRWARRDPAHPVTIFVGTNTPLPIPVDRLVTLKSLMAEATPVDELIGKGIVPTDSKGQWALFAAALRDRLGLTKTAGAWRMLVARSPELAARLAAARRARSDAQTPTGIDHIGVCASEGSSEWQMLLPGCRYRAGVFLDGIATGDVSAAMQKLAVVGVIPTHLDHVEPQPKADPSPLEEPDRSEAKTPTEPGVVIQASFPEPPDEPQPIHPPDLEPEPIPFPVAPPDPAPPQSPPSRAWHIGYWKPRDHTAEGEADLAALDDLPPSLPRKVAP